MFGVSSQSTANQQEAVQRLTLPFAMLSDPGLAVASALDLPTFTAAGQQLYTRLTLVVDDKRITHVFCPVFPPGEHAGQVLDWLHDHPATQRRAGLTQ